jgi:hypothetical protein
VLVTKLKSKIKRPVPGNAKVASQPKPVVTVLNQELTETLTKMSARPRITNPKTSNAVIIAIILPSLKPKMSKPVPGNAQVTRMYLSVAMV